MFSAVRMRQKEKSIIASQRNMNSVSFIFHTVKMTWPSFPQKSKYLQSVFSSIAGHIFSINIFWIENCDFILVVLLKNRVFFGSNGVFAAESVSALSHKGCSSAAFCLCGCGPLASSLSYWAHHSHSAATPPSSNRDNGAARGGCSLAAEPCLRSRVPKGPHDYFSVRLHCLCMSLCVYSSCVQSLWVTSLAWDVCRVERERMRLGCPFPAPSSAPLCLLLNLKEQVGSPTISVQPQQLPGLYSAFSLVLPPTAAQSWPQQQWPSKGARHLCLLGQALPPVTRNGDITL